MRKLLAVAVGLLGTVVASFAACDLFSLATFLWLAPQFCSDRVEHTILSPDARYKALLMWRTCGFAPETYAHVDLLRASENPAIDRSSGTIEPNTVMAITETYESFSVRWPAMRSLHIRCTGCASPVDSKGVLARKTHWEDLTISYEAAAI